MKVSPEYIIQLSHRVNTLHREKKKEKFNEVQVKRTGKLLRTQVKGTRKHCRPRSKDRVNILYVN